LNSDNQIGPKVSILVPIYGVELYIERCAHSLFNQTFSDAEYIFVDDCTQDGSIEILNSVIAKYPDVSLRTRIICHSCNKGIGATRKTALDAAKGQYVLFVDSDDYIEEDMVELLFKKAIEVDADIVFCSYMNDYSNGNSVRYRVKPTEIKVELVKNAFSHPSFWNKMFKRDVMIKNRLEIQVGINYGEDLALIPILIYYSKSFAFVDKPLYHYVQYNANSLSKEFSTVNLNQTLRVVAILNDFFLDKPVFHESVIYLKAIRKAKILRSGQIGKQYVDLFPEIDLFINQLDIDNKTKILLLLAARKWYFFLRLFVRILVRKRVSYL
jgi:glycosyltransferase involved in cell wall biosynthesis